MNFAPLNEDEYRQCPICGKKLTREEMGHTQGQCLDCWEKLVKMHRLEGDLDVIIEQLSWVNTHIKEYTCHANESEEQMSYKLRFLNDLKPIKHHLCLLFYTHMKALNEVKTSLERATTRR